MLGNVKDQLPQPVLEGREDYVRLYEKAWEIAFQNVDPVDKAGWKPMMTCMPGIGIIWMWDSCFMTFISNYSNGTISAFHNLDNLYRLQRKDGYISMAYRIDSEQPAYGERINPPLLAWAEWEYYMISGDCSRFEKVLPKLEGLYDYLEANYRRSCGLYFFEDPGSSGMDNAPRGGYPAYDLKGSDVCYVDLACQQALSAECISNMYEVCKKQEKATFFAMENKRICKLIQQYHYQEKTGFYYDFFARNKSTLKVKLINSKTAAAFWTLLCGAAKNQYADAMAAHLLDPKEFYGHTPFASLSKDDLNYDATGGYWLGSSWHPTNYVAVRGLYKNGYIKEAREATVKILDVMCKVAENNDYGSIWECYAPEADLPATRENGELVQENFVGWGGLEPITMLIEHVIGLHFYARENHICFDVYHDKKSGLRNMIFRGGKVSIECLGYHSCPGKTRIRVEAEKSFVLTVSLRNERWQKFHVTTGVQMFEM